ncbi:MAG TPA: class I SAM-dependent methyltransferase [Phycisphaerales bacterium]|nr:class I SAM-dependent methyltransferase [Phycisphaerales bacterium]
MKKQGWAPYPRYIFRKEIALSLITKNVPRGSEFLEIGCAAGDFGITLSKKGYTGTMIDFSDKASDEVAKNIKKEKAENIRFENKDFFDIDTDGRFDLITMFEVLEHIEKDEKALKKINELLRPGGTFLCSVPAKKKLWGASDIIAGHIKRYDKEELVYLMNQSGFEIAALFSYGFPWLNIIKYVRDKMACKALKKDGVNNRDSLTKKSGLNPTAIKVPSLEIFFNKYLLFFPIKISNLFNNMDLAEGYLCLAKKNDRRATTKKF